MGREDDGARVVFERLLELVLGWQIEVVGRLVEQQELTRLQEQLGQAQAALFATRERANQLKTSSWVNRKRANRPRTDSTPQPFGACVRTSSTTVRVSSSVCDWSCAK